MINFNKVLPIICLVVILGMISESVGGKKNELCKIRFPDGFFCDSVCEKWHVLPGKTFLCFISHEGSYHSFVARYPAFGVWRFFYVDSQTDSNDICQRSLTGEKFFVNNTEIKCSAPYVDARRHKRYTSDDHSAKTQHSHSGLGPALKRFEESKVPLDAICSLATTQVCRENRMIHCPSAKRCCFAETNPETCDETALSEHDECYKALDSVFQTLLF